ncbi:MAG: aminopeptidase [Chloroflexota bacterium]|jgi:aminopeptidase
MVDSRELKRIARVVLEQALGLQPDERVLIVGNPEEASRLICDAYFEATRELSGKPLLVRQPAKGITDFSDPAVLAAIASEPDILLSISTDKIGKDPHGLHIGYVGRNGQKYTHIFDRVTDGDKRSRAGTSPGIKLDTFLRAMDVDYAAIRSSAAALKASIQGCSKMRIETPAGTDLTVGLRGRQIFVDDGDLRKPGAHGNLPCGEIFFSPELGTAQGRIVFDGLIAMGTECLLPTEPLVMEVKNGYVTHILPSAHSDAVEAMLAKSSKQALAMGKEDYARNARGIGEVGLGLNPDAEMIPDMLEAEKVSGTCHVAIGSNYDRDLQALTHYDMLMLRPRITVDGRPLKGYTQ